jgi:hypothetical protein
MLPSTLPHAFLRAIALRSLVVWACLRSALFILFALVVEPPVALVVPEPPAAGLIVVLAAALTTWDGRRRNEHIFLANLGISLWPRAMLAGVLPLSGELAVRLLA